MLVLGDAHASTPERRNALLAAYRAVYGDPSRDFETTEPSRAPDVALQVGDLEYYDLPVPTWFVAGNNEDFDVIDSLRVRERSDRSRDVRNAHLLASTAAEVAGLRIAGLSGNFAPTQYDRSRDELEGDRRRHFTREDVERAAALEGVDVLLTHEAPTGLLWYGYDPGCEHVTDLLDRLEPELCLVGHYHRHRESEIEGVRTVSLAPVWERYYTLDPDDLKLTAYETPVEADPPE